MTLTDRARLWRVLERERDGAESRAAQERSRARELQVQMDNVWRGMTEDECRAIEPPAPAIDYYDGPEEETVRVVLASVPRA